jgi:hypothetical protein
MRYIRDVGPLQDEQHYIEWHLRQVDDEEEESEWTRTRRRTFYWDQDGNSDEKVGPDILSVSTLAGQASFTSILSSKGPKKVRFDSRSTLITSTQTNSTSSLRPAADDKTLSTSNYGGLSLQPDSKSTGDDDAVAAAAAGAETSSELYDPLSVVMTTRRVGLSQLNNSSIGHTTTDHLTSGYPTTALTSPDLASRLVLGAAAVDEFSEYTGISPGDELLSWRQADSGVGDFNATNSQRDIDLERYATNASMSQTLSSLSAAGSDTRQLSRQCTKFKDENNDDIVRGGDGSRRESKRRAATGASGEASVFVPSANRGGQDGRRGSNAAAVDNWSAANDVERTSGLPPVDRGRTSVRWNSQLGGGSTSDGTWTPAAPPRRLNHPEDAVTSSPDVRRSQRRRKFLPLLPYNPEMYEMYKKRESLLAVCRTETETYHCRKCEAITA